VDVVDELGSEPLYERVGLVDFRRREYDGGGQRVVDGVLYGLGGGTWTRIELGSREVIGPVWLLDLLSGATEAWHVGSERERAARSIEGVADLYVARMATGRMLEGVGGAPRSSMSTISVAATVSADGLPERVTAQVHDHRLSCEFWDYGNAGQIAAPTHAVSLYESD
jgi:hypothetical protein